MFDITRLLQTLSDALSLGSLYALIAIGYTAFCASSILRMAKSS